MSGIIGRRMANRGISAFVRTLLNFDLCFCTWYFYLWIIFLFFGIQNMNQFMLRSRVFASRKFSSAAKEVIFFFTFISHSNTFIWCLILLIKRHYIKTCVDDCSWCSKFCSTWRDVCRSKGLYNGRGGINDYFFVFF